MKQKRMARVCCILMALILIAEFTMESRAFYIYEAKWNGFTYSPAYVEATGKYSRTRVTIDNYSGKARELTIPRKIKGNVVESVESLRGAKNLRTLHIPNGIDVTSSVSSAPKLRKITVSKANKRYKVKNHALLNKDGSILRGYAGGYKTVKIPDSVGMVGEYACSSGNFTDIKWGKNTKDIGCSAFAYNRQLKTVVIDKNVEYIDNLAFYGCRNLKKVVLGTNVKKVCYNAFNECNKLKSIYIYNKNCKLDMSSIDLTFPKKATIYGVKGSTAEKYARKFKMKFKPI